MKNSGIIIQQLFSIRNKFEKQDAPEKIRLLNSVKLRTVKSKKAIQLYADSLLFLIAYPDNKTVYTLANQHLLQLHQYLRENEKISYSLYNSGITGTNVCAAYSFEMVKWLRKQYRNSIRIVSFEASDGQINAILCAMMTKLESEILQDSYFTWKEWVTKTLHPQEDLLDGLIAIFENNNSRPEVKDELWAAIGINIEISFTTHSSLTGSLLIPYYHRSLLRKQVKLQPVFNPVRVKLTDAQAAQIVDCSKMILVRHLREIDPISFTDPTLVSYYQLPRGLGIALMGMTPERRHPIDCYMGYTVFKNGLPVAYAGSWLLFDSGRIGLNVFPSYRGGESQYIFQQVLQLHARVYRLKRFTVDPYQIGNKNSDGIHSGAFWVYYNAGFRPLLKTQLELAATEAVKISSISRYRSPGTVLKKLADSKLEMFLKKNTVRFDANDLSLAYAAILKNQFSNNRLQAEKDTIKNLATILQIKNYEEVKMKFILQNWSVLLLYNEAELCSNSTLKKILKSLFILKASGSEEIYIRLLQKAKPLQKLVENTLKQYDLQSLVPNN